MSFSARVRARRVRFYICLKSGATKLWFFSAYAFIRNVRVNTVIDELAFATRYNILTHARTYTCVLPLNFIYTTNKNNNNNDDDDLFKSNCIKSVSPLSLHALTLASVICYSISLCFIFQILNELTEFQLFPSFITNFEFDSKQKTRRQPKRRRKSKQRTRVLNEAI